MKHVMPIRNYGTKKMNEFPNPDDVREILEEGEIAYIRDMATSNDYILTKQLSCWTMVDGGLILSESITKKHIEKVYKVEFMEYTNCMRDTVSNQEREIGKRKYLHVGGEPFLVKESELETYRTWGGGFRHIEFIGNIEV